VSCLTGSAGGQASPVYTQLLGAGMSRRVKHGKPFCPPGPCHREGPGKQTMSVDYEYHCADTGIMRQKRDSELSLGLRFQEVIGSLADFL
jgi:hypothetical protein